MERPSVREQNLSRYLSKNLRLDPHNLTLSHVGSEASIDGTAASDGGVGATARVTHRRLESLSDAFGGAGASTTGSAGGTGGSGAEVRSIHWSPYDPVHVVNADP